MYFPWVGMHEQLRLADDFVDYSDVAFSKGSFTNRVQVKTHSGMQWLTLPLHGLRQGQLIQEVRLDERQNWRRKHRSTLEQAYARAPFVKDLLSLVDEVFETTNDSLAETSLASMKAVHRYFGFERPLRWHLSPDLGIEGASTARVLEIVKRLGGTRYITGHGASAYLDHSAFDDAGIAVEYLAYQKVPYPQLHGDFTPYVTALDLVANCGRDGSRYFCSDTQNWREYTT